jgi:hypothetical protein
MRVRFSTIPIGATPAVAAARVARQRVTPGEATRGFAAETA